MRKNLLFPILLAAWPTGPLTAQDTSARDAFVDANILAIFYHELGHAVIDLMEVPIFGQEEDAADVMAVLLIDWVFDEETASAIAYDSAFGYISDPDGTEDVAYWDLHGPDEQRYYNHVCLFYGANPDERSDLAEDLGLPADRAETCPEEYDLAAESWGAVFDEMADLDSGGQVSLRAVDSREAEVIRSVLSEEIDSLNADIRLTADVDVTIEACGEANAFYDPAETQIIVCTEFVTYLEDLFDRF